jgi:hypothetical protein
MHFFITRNRALHQSGRAQVPKDALTKIMIASGLTGAWPKKFSACEIERSPRGASRAGSLTFVSQPFRLGASAARDAPRGRRSVSRALKIQRHAPLRHTPHFG